jgi:hypothetical protein
MIERYKQVGLRGAWVIAITAPLAASLLMVPLRTHTQASNLALVMVAVVVAAAVPGFHLAAIAAGVSAGVWFRRTRGTLIRCVSRSMYDQTLHGRSWVEHTMGRWWSESLRRRREEKRLAQRSR